MNYLINYITKTCIRHQIISSNQVAWFKYGLEKRISSVFVSFPFFLLAVVLSNLHVAFSFFLCFYIIRSKANGYHAKSFWGCFFLSLMHVTIFVGVLYRLLNIFTLNIIAIVGTILISRLAPFNSKEMHLSKSESLCCRRSSRKRSFCILLLGFSLQTLGQSAITKGLFLGIAMAAYLLCLAYYINWRKKNENHPREHQEHCT